MQGERGSLIDLQRYHRGTDSNKRRLATNKNQIAEEDEVDGLADHATSSDSKSVSVPKIPKPNLQTKSLKSSPRTKRSEKDFIKEECSFEKGK